MGDIMWEDRMMWSTRRISGSEDTRMLRVIKQGGQEHPSHSPSKHRSFHTDDNDKEYKYDVSKLPNKCRA